MAVINVKMYQCYYCTSSVTLSLANSTYLYLCLGSSPGTNDPDSDSELDESNSILIGNELIGDGLRCNSF